MESRKTNNNKDTIILVFTERLAELMSSDDWAKANFFPITNRISEIPMMDDKFLDTYRKETGKKESWRTRHGRKTYERG